MNIQRSLPDRSRDRMSCAGKSLLEVVIFLPLLLSIVCVFVDLSLVFKSYLSVSDAVRGSISSLSAKSAQFGGVQFKSAEDMRSDPATIAKVADTLFQEIDGQLRERLLLNIATWQKQCRIAVVPIGLEFNAETGALLSYRPHYSEASTSQLVGYGGSQSRDEAGCDTDVSQYLLSQFSIDQSLSRQDSSPSRYASSVLHRGSGDSAYGTIVTGVFADILSDAPGYHTFITVYLVEVSVVPQTPSLGIFKGMLKRMGACHRQIITPRRLIG